MGPGPAPRKAPPPRGPRPSGPLPAPVPQLRGREPSCSDPLLLPRRPLLRCRVAPGARPTRLHPQPGSRRSRPQPSPPPPAGRPRPHHGEGDVQLGAGPEGGQEGRSQEQRGGAHHPPGCRGGGLQGPGWGRGRGPRGGDGRPERPSAPRVPWCVCLGRDGVSALATPAGTVAEACELRQLLHLVWSPGDLQRLAPPPPSLALSSRINTVPKMADIITSLNLCCFLLSFLG